MYKPLNMIIEALLFASDKPLRARDIHNILPEEDLASIEAALEDLKAGYEALGRSFFLKQVAGGYQFRTRSKYASYILNMLNTSSPKLSRAALETLAIIAYKQPVLRQEIERLRGVDVGGILRSLMERNLIRIVGRKNLPGKPLIYGTTTKFLEVFDLKSLESLPKQKEIKELGLDQQGQPGLQGSDEQSEGAEEKGTEQAEERGSPKTFEQDFVGKQPSSRTKEEDSSETAAAPSEKTSESG